ncbi:FAD-dependent oxidoreductase [Desulfosudis oleivorans]|uniref:FAD-dependent pyridine nucleotide-disulphide oxidoreductase n=1 Tax=Desulfosudis oleivorans (strain DSM 6200 / JCM 39069 / Hxd3) TaxID=96561 RepID=A8ZX06_DESOH|nr:FAD-dependent oxidoreductase [Desulfosudis oleivorans]ABW66862.1 FAD-dependent pyridine nucleotide-disulphide oxidoreductase [Desulfosudis oleivorans Hxd3]
MSRRIVVVGGVALGSKAACRAKRVDPEADVYLIDRDEYISYGGCGIPFYISGDVSDVSELRSTSFHMLRDERFFLKDKGVVALTGTEVTRIDRQGKTVAIRRKDGTTDTLAYDKLVLATGTTPRMLPLPGRDLENVFTVANLHDALAIKEKVTEGSIGKAVVVGGGFIGLEMAEALADMWEIETSIVEVFDQIMPGFVSPSLATMARKTIEDKGVRVYTSEKVEALVGEGAVSAVKTDKRTLDADMVIMAVGVVPNTGLAKEAGLEVTPQGWIVVNDQMQTSDPDIYSGGDCAAVKNLVTGELGYFPLGSMANRQGRVIGTNVTGGSARFDGAVGSFVVKIFDNALAGAGLTADRASAAGFDAVGIQVAQFDRAHFYIEKEVIFLELVVDEKTRRVLGIQGFGGKDSGMVARINAVAPLLKYKPGVEEISNLELAYSPPFASAMDIINALGNAASNYLDGRYRPMTMEAFAACWENRSCGDTFFLDCRANADAQPFADKYPEIWKSIPHDQLVDRMDEVPKGKKLVLLCNTGVRSYEAQLNLNAKGITDNVSAGAGIAGLKTWGVDFGLDK